MDAKRFLAEFKRIASAPSGVQRLRELILQLAVSGRLVHRDHAEEAVEVALAEAERHRIQFEIDFGLRRAPLHPALRENEHPYVIPDHWCWQRLERIACYVQRGRGPSYANSGSTFVVSQKCIRWKGFDLSAARHVDEASLKRYGKERFLRAGDLLLNSTGTGTVGRTAIYNEKGGVRAVADSHVTVVRLSNFVPRYVWCVIAAPWVQARVAPEHEDSIVSGTTKQVELATGSVRALAIPCPPIGEQKRIVAKVDELMALCDKLEAQQREREALGKRACLSALNFLADADTSNDLKVAWRLVEENFSSLLDAPGAADDFSKAVKELALRGLLSANDDEAVDGLLESIAVQKKGKRTARLRATKPLFDIPNGWRWVLLEDLLHDSESGWSPKCESSPRQGDEWGVLKVSAVTWGRFQPNENKRLSRALEPAAKAEVKPGDFLLSRANTAELVARSVIAPADCPKRLMMSDKVVRLNFIDDRLKPWVNLANNSRFARNYYIANATGTSDSMKNVSRRVIHELAIPLPPLGTQIKLIAAVEKLESLCESLRARITQARATSRDLAAACVAALTGIRIKEKEKMKAPKTELVSTLRVGVVPTNGDRAPLTAALLRNNGELPAKTLWTMSGLEIDAFYQQLKTEMARGWIVQPEAPYVKVVEVG